MLEADPNEAFTGTRKATRPYMSGTAGEPEVVGLLLTKSANVNARDKHDRTPLHKARKIGVVKLLLSNYASVNARDEHGQTPLFGAAINGNREIVELLIAKGSDVNARDNEADTFA